MNIVNFIGLRSVCVKGPTFIVKSDRNEGYTLERASERASAPDSRGVFYDRASPFLTEKKTMGESHRTMIGGWLLFCPSMSHTIDIRHCERPSILTSRVISSTLILLITILRDIDLDLELQK